MEPTETLPLGPQPPRKPDEPLARGSAVGRYVVLERIGSGGMGVVYAAYDPELDRKVALKLLRPDRAGAVGEAALRLQREAQAIARLSDPHVVAVYDAGTFGDQVFVAMELMEGRTLRQWLAAEKRGWREIVDVFVAAGRGLAAAHAAGLVHRDFKPDNVLLGTDGRVKVADFGLARPSGVAEKEGTASSPGSGSGSLLASPLTEWGVVMGTPAYMAPEQLRGGAADARSDQFSFCVALWEALYGQKPFAGAGLREMLDAERRGEVREPPEGTGVPARLQPVLRQGLSASPEARYPGMPELLHNLQHDPAVSRRRWLIAAVLILATAALFSSLGYFQARRAQLCGGAEEKLAGVWDEPRKEAAHKAFLATKAPFAADVWKTVEKALDRYGADWTSMRRQACEATRVRGEQSEDLLDRRMFCLDQHLQDMAATTQLFTQADFQIVDKAVPAVNKLSPIADCANVEILTAKVPPPRDPKLRQRVASVRAVVAEAKALQKAGKRPQALAKATSAEQMARPLGYKPLEAEALYQKGFVQDLTGDHHGAEDTLFEALTTAQAAGDQEVAARSAAQLSWLTGYEQSRAADGEKWARLAQSIAEGARGGPVLRAELLEQLGAIRMNEHRFKEGLDLSLEALSQAEKADPGSPRAASILNNIGEALNQLGRYDEALRYALRSLKIREKTLPPGHPDFGPLFNTIGNIYTGLHRNQEAITEFEQAIEIDRKQYGPKYWLVGGGLVGLASAHQFMGHLDVALRLDREALAIFEEDFGPEHPYDALALGNMGEVQLLKNQPAEALASFQRAVAIQEKTLGANNPTMAHGLTGIARALSRLGRAREAIAPGERALALFESRAGNPLFLNQARFFLAQALWDGGGDRVRATRLARQGREGLAAVQEEDEVKQIDDWLRQRGLTP
jgi:tetratricopeptide (TPR) repeat protein